MADYHYGGSEEENAELRKLEVDLVWCMRVARDFDIILRRR